MFTRLGYDTEQIVLPLDILNILELFRAKPVARGLALKTRIWSKPSVEEREVFASLTIPLGLSTDRPRLDGC